MTIPFKPRGSRELPEPLFQHQRALTDLGQILRGEELANFRLTVTRQAGQWTVETVDLDAPATYPRSDLTIGEGGTFADAWEAQQPTWGRDS